MPRRPSPATPLTADRERALLDAAARAGLVDGEPLCPVAACLSTVPDRWYRSSVRPGHETARCRAGHVVHRRIGETQPERETPRPWSPPPPAPGAVADLQEPADEGTAQRPPARGVWRESRSGRWRAKQERGGKTVYLGSFATPAEADAAVERFRRQQAAGENGPQSAQDGAGRAIGPETYSDAPLARSALLGAC